MAHLITLERFQWTDHDDQLPFPSKERQCFENEALAISRARAEDTVVLLPGENPSHERVANHHVCTRA